VIFITTAKNDADLKPAFDQRVKGLARNIPIEFGDFSFFGKWEGGQPYRITGDRKHLGDMLKCIEDGRFIHQIQRAREAGFDQIFLILESVYRASPRDNIVQVKRGNGWVDAQPRTDHSRLDTYINELDVYAGVLVRRSRSLRETVEIVLNLYTMFQTAPEDHSSLTKVWTAPRPQAMSFLSKPPSLVRVVASDLPGVGWKRSELFDEEFDSVKEMINADRVRLTDMEGIGGKTADKILEAIGQIGRE
jgi:ERCC4-type nuclease